MKNRQIAAAEKVEAPVAESDINNIMEVEMSNAWICTACSYINLGVAKGPCCMCQTDGKDKCSFIMLDPYEIEESAKLSYTADNPSKLRPFGDINFECAAMRFCHDTDYLDITSEQVLCIICNQLAHHYCSDNFQEQSPVELDYVITNKDLCCSGKTHFNNIPVRQCNTIFLAA
jgi:hypothetical protein